MNIEVFCPTRFEIKQWSDRKKKIKRPLLPSILFVKTTEENRDSVFSIPMINITKTSYQATIIEDT